MVQVLSYTRVPPPPSNRPEFECVCVCVGLSLGLLILKFFNNVSLKLLGSNSIGFGGGFSQIELGLIDFGLDRELGLAYSCTSYWRLIGTNCPTAAWLVYKEDLNPMQKKVVFPTYYNPYFFYFWKFPFSFLSVSESIIQFGSQDLCLVVLR